jgi:chromosome segregation ATPase
LDAFPRGKKALDDLITQLLAETADEIKHKDFCVDEFNTNQLQTEKKEREKKALIAQIADLEMTIKTLAEAIETLKSEIAEMQVQMKRAGEDREKENKEFQSTVADQRETQTLLKAALTALEGYYGKPAAALAQKQAPVGPPPPPGFDAYKNSAMNGGVMGMLTQIINDAKNMEAEAIRAEEDSQKAYEDFVKETNGSINTKSDEIINTSDEKAKAEADLVEAKSSKDAVMLELEQLSNYNAQLHASCDFVMKNFDLRQTARDEEVEALRQAKAILSGAKFSEFLQGA